MSANAEVVKRFIEEALNRGHLETIAKTVAPKYRYHGPGGIEAEGVEGLEQIVMGFRTAFSDLHIEITSEIAQGDMVALTMVATGTHDGALMDLPPTGAKMELPIAVVSRVEDGLIAEEWEYYDNATMMAQLTATDSPTTLVLGATGKTGRRVVERLTAVGHSVRSASRSSEVRFDWGDESTWAPALTDVDSVYIVYYPDLAFPGAADTVGRLADLAVASGVQRLVLLSGRGEEGARQAEIRVQNSGADWTIVRCAFFNQNFNEAFVEAVRHGVLAMPAGDTAEPFLDADDIADVVVAALTDDRHIGRLYELTGPRLLTLTEVAASFSAALEREVQYIPVTTDEFLGQLVASGMPEEEAAPFAGLVAEVLDGRNAYLTDGVVQALGRPPRDFADYVRDTAPSGVWNPESASS